MRGNETCQCCAMPAASGVFPIPMRGNETQLGTMVHAELEFPIPMRGNEHQVSVLDPTQASNVSDPHEG